MKSLQRLLHYSHQHRADYIWGTLFSILNKFFDVAPEILIGVVIDVVVSKKESFVARLGYAEPKEQIVFLAVLTLIIWVSESIFEYLYLLRWKNLAQKIQHEARRDVYRHLQNLDLEYFEDKNSGALVSILNDDVNQLERFLNNGANSLIQVGTAIILIGGVFFYLSPTIAVLSFLPMPFIFFGAVYFQKKSEPLYAHVRSKVSDLASHLTANISGVATIKAFSREERELQKLETLSSNYQRANEEAIRVSSAFIPVIRMGILAGFVCTLVIGGFKTLNGELNVGLYGVLIFLTQRLLWPMTGLAETIDLYQRSMASVDRILDVLETSITVKSNSKALKNFDAKADLKFAKVGFSYRNGFKALEDLNVLIPSGKTTAFVGPTGSGKSTLVKILMRFYDPTKGQVLLGQQDIRDLDLKSYRDQIGWVSQDVTLFDGSIIDNISFGKAGASEAEIIAAAKAAEAHDFILQLPEGYKTLVGERGQKLSGGQKQRLALARAILKNPTILILDEATSAVDNETESLIQKSLVKITHDRTTIVIAHRLSTIVSADIIYVIDNGRVVEQGTHQSLVKKMGTYSTLWNYQVNHSQM